MQSRVPLEPALKEVPQRLHRIFRSIGSTARILISPNTILEGRILWWNVAIVRVKRGD